MVETQAPHKRRNIILLVGIGLMVVCCIGPLAWSIYYSTTPAYKAKATARYIRKAETATSQALAAATEAAHPKNTLTPVRTPESKDMYKLTPTPVLPILIATKWGKVIIESIQFREQAFWHDEPVRLKNDVWIAIFFTAINQTDNCEYIHTDDMRLVINGVESLTIDRDATGGIGLDEGIPHTPSGYSGLKVPQHSSVRSVVVYDTPIDLQRLQLRYKGSTYGLPLPTTPTPTPTPIPITPTLTPTFTSTPIPALTPTSTTPTLTNTPYPIGEVVPNGLNLRSGPGTEYQVVKRLRKGDHLGIVGEAPDRIWFKVRTSDGTEGWVHSGYVTVTEGIIDQLPIIEPPPSPSTFLTSGPTATSRPSVTPKPAPSWQVIKEWHGHGIKTTENFVISATEWRVRWVNREDGYFGVYVYRNGELYWRSPLIGNVTAAGSDVSYIYEAGTFHFTVNAVGSWDVYVEVLR